MAENDMLKEIKMRQIGEGDEALIADFFAVMGAESRALFNRRGYNERGVLKYCARPDATRKYWMAELDGKMAGYVFFLDWNSSIPCMGVAVRDDLRGMGIGTYLVSFAQKTAKEAGKGGLFLSTHTANLRAQVLYEELGFECMGLCKNGTELFYLFRYRE